MTYHIVAIPQEKDLKILNKLRNYIYLNNYRFKNKPITSDTHITISEIDIEESRIEELKNVLSKTIKHIPFELTDTEWEVVKENKEPNCKQDKPYTWIALKFPQIKKLYAEVDSITRDMSINGNQRYIDNVKIIEKKEGDYIGNHINLSNYTRREKANECWQYFKDNLPNKITFNKIALRDLKGNHIFEIEY